jgi:hypothetical protein
MKTIYFIAPMFMSFLLAISTQMFAQTIDQVLVEGSNCTTYGGNCFDVDPEIGAGSYVANPYTTDIPSNAERTYKWTITGGTFTNGTNDTSPQPFIIWSNTKNFNGGSPTHTIKCKVTLKWFLQGAVQPTIRDKESLPKTVFVKYIGNVGTITINGSGYSGTAVLPCGTTSHNISVPAVEVDVPYPTVTYLWTYPSGWSGPASTTVPNVTATSSAGGSGILKVTAKRNDGNVQKSNQIQINRPLPTLSSVTGAVSGNFGPLLCNSSQTETYTASGSNADKFIWTPSANVRVNGSSSAQNVAGSVSISAVGKGSFNVKAYSTTCQASSTGAGIDRSVDFGAASISSQGQYRFDTYVEHLYIGFPSGQTATYTWAVLSGDPILNQNYGPAVYATSYSGGSVSVTPSNACGTGSPAYFTVPAYGQFLMAYPNPATDVLTLEFKSTEVKESLPASIELYSESSTKSVKSVSVQDIAKNNAFKDGNKIELRVADLPRGIYYLHVKPNEKQKQEVQKMRIRLD